MIRVGIIGGAGYTAGELLRLLINHPDVCLVFVHSNSHAGQPIAQVHSGLWGEIDLNFTDTYDWSTIDCVFFCTAHGDTKKFMEMHEMPEDLRIIDLSTDYRMESPEHEFIYGLPELNRKRIIRGKRIANPGCFATAIQLALLPLAKNHLLENEVHVHAITGSTGAGQKPTSTTHFSWRDNNMSIYKPFTHQHLHEIKQTLTTLQPGFDQAVNFIPLRGNFSRGIFVSIYTKVTPSLEQVKALYEEAYADHSFTFVTSQSLDLKQVVNTNKALISLEQHGEYLLITCCIDNLLKGASGQAVHNMNLLFGLTERVGLSLKPSAF